MHARRVLSPSDNQAANNGSVARNFLSERRVLTKRAGCGCARDSLLKGRRFMRRGIFRPRVLLLSWKIVCVHVGAFLGAAQGPGQSHPGFFRTLPRSVELVGRWVV